MMSSPTVLASVTMSLLDGAAREGLSREQLLQSAGIAPDLVTSPDARVPCDRDALLWRQVMRETGDAAFGLRLAQTDIPARSFGIIGFLAMTSATVGEAFARVVRYHRVLRENVDKRVVLLGDAVAVEEATPAPLDAWEDDYEEFCSAASIMLARRWSGETLTPLEVRLRRGKPAHAADYERLFGCRVRFDQPRHGLVLPRAQLALPLRTEQRDMCAYLEQLCEGALARLPTAEDPLGDVVHALRGELATGSDLRLERVARRLGVGARTLQRRLAERGVVFQELQDRVRKAEALSLLTRSSLTLDVIAERVGYADPKAFRRAFRRWTGITPSEARRRTIAPATPEPVLFT